MKTIQMKRTISTIRNGDNVDLLVVVSNDGPDDASDVSVSLSDLESLGLMVLNSSDDSYNQKDNEWIIGDLANGDSVSLSISTRANKSGENITVLSEVGTSTFELNKENNLDNDSLNILPVCDVEITITPDNSLVNAGDTVNWIMVRTMLVMLMYSIVYLKDWNLFIPSQIREKWKTSLMKKAMSLISFGK